MHATIEYPIGALPSLRIQSMPAPSDGAQRKTPTTATKRIATVSTKARSNYSARRNESTRFSSEDSRTGAPVDNNVTAEEKRKSMTCSPSAKGPARGSSGGNALKHDRHNMQQCLGHCRRRRQ